MGGSICFLPVGAPFDNLAARWHVTSKVFVDSSASVFRWAAGGGNAGAAVAYGLSPGAGAGAATTGLALHYGQSCRRWSLAKLKFKSSTQARAHPCSLNIIQLLLTRTTDWNTVFFPFWGIRGLLVNSTHVCTTSLASSNVAFE